MISVSFALVKLYSDGITLERATSTYRAAKLSLAVWPCSVSIVMTFVVSTSCQSHITVIRSANNAPVAIRCPVSSRIAVPTCERESFLSLLPNILPVPAFGGTFSDESIVASDAFLTKLLKKSFTFVGLDFAFGGSDPDSSRECSSSDPKPEARLILPILFLVEDSPKEDTENGSEFLSNPLPLILLTRTLSDAWIRLSSFFSRLHLEIQYFGKKYCKQDQLLETFTRNEVRINRAMRLTLPTVNTSGQSNGMGVAWRCPGQGNPIAFKRTWIEICFAKFGLMYETLYKMVSRATVSNQNMWLPACQLQMLVLQL
mmetsp:Transcript_18200/g.38048  ORF Transcript_18200/g.38048 Transcript_18200/m.38048 type:complete len:315 (-) Transcript_18200:709-1653(-)